MQLGHLAKRKKTKLKNKSKLIKQLAKLISRDQFSSRHLIGFLISKLRCQVTKHSCIIRLDTNSASCASCKVKSEVAASWFQNPGKRIPLKEQLDKSSLGRSIPSTLGPCLDKYLDVFSCPKVSQKMELSRSSKQTLNLAFAGFCLGWRCMRFLDWMTGQMNSNWGVWGLVGKLRS